MWHKQTRNLRSNYITGFGVPQRVRMNTFLIQRRPVWQDVTRMLRRWRCFPRFSERTEGKFSSDLAAKKGEWWVFIIVGAVVL